MSSVGAFEGCEVVGTRDGHALGLAEGRLVVGVRVVGLFEGSADGNGLGDLVGCVLGLLVDGIAVGLGEGRAVGANDGCEVVGTLVGVGVGRSVLQCPFASYCRPLTTMLQSPKAPSQVRRGSQSLLSQHANPSPQPLHWPPPQSTDVSAPFFIPSAHVAEEGEMVGFKVGFGEGLAEGIGDGNALGNGVGVELGSGEGPGEG